jgi:hypothetical protein
MIHNSDNLWLSISVVWAALLHRSAVTWFAVLCYFELMKNGPPASAKIAGAVSFAYRLRRLAWLARRCCSLPLLAERSSSPAIFRSPAARLVVGIIGSVAAGFLGPS